MRSAELCATGPFVFMAVKKVNCYSVHLLSSLNLVASEFSPNIIWSFFFINKFAYSWLQSQAKNIIISFSFLFFLLMFFWLHSTLVFEFDNGHCIEWNWKLSWFSLSRGICYYFTEEVSEWNKMVWWFLLPVKVNIQ